MSTKSNISLIILVLIAGFIWGSFSSTVLSKNINDKIQTKCLEIVDDNGNVRIKLYASAKNYFGGGNSVGMNADSVNAIMRTLSSTPSQGLIFIDDKGNKRLSFGNFNGKYSIIIFDEHNEIFWEPLKPLLKFAE